MVLALRNFQEKAQKFEIDKELEYSKILDSVSDLQKSLADIKKENSCMSTSTIFSQLNKEMDYFESTFQQIEHMLDSNSSNLESPDINQLTYQLQDIETCFDNVSQLKESISYVQANMDKFMKKNDFDDISEATDIIKKKFSSLNTNEAKNLNHQIEFNGDEFWKDPELYITNLLKSIKNLNNSIKNIRPKFIEYQGIDEAVDELHNSYNNISLIQKNINILKEFNRDDLASNCSSGNTENIIIEQFTKMNNDYENIQRKIRKPVLTYNGSKMRLDEESYETFQEVISQVDKLNTGLNKIQRKVSSFVTKDAAMEQMNKLAPKITKIENDIKSFQVNADDLDVMTAEQVQGILDQMKAAEKKIKNINEQSSYLLSEFGDMQNNFSKLTDESNLVQSQLDTIAKSFDKIGNTTSGNTVNERIKRLETDLLMLSAFSKYKSQNPEEELKNIQNDLNEFIKKSKERINEITTGNINMDERHKNLNLIIENSIKSVNEGNTALIKTADSKISEISSNYKKFIQNELASAGDKIMLNAMLISPVDEIRSSAMKIKQDTFSKISKLSKTAPSKRVFSEVDDSLTESKEKAMQQLRSIEDDLKMDIPEEITPITKRLLQDVSDSISDLKETDSKLQKAGEMLEPIIASIGTKVSQLSSSINAIRHKKPIPKFDQQKAASEFSFKVLEAQKKRVLASAPQRKDELTAILNQIGRVESQVSAAEELLPKSIQLERMQLTVTDHASSVGRRPRLLEADKGRNVPELRKRLKKIQEQVERVEKLIV